jgi:hypothetical protein
VTAESRHNGSVFGVFKVNNKKYWVYYQTGFWFTAVPASWKKGFD